MHRGAVAEIDLDAVSENFNTVRYKTGGLHVIAVVKADAYGHGAVEVSERLAADGVYCLAVAFLDEAVKLREAGIKAKMLVLFDKDGIPDYFRYSLIPVIHDVHTAKRFSEEAKSMNRSIDIHLKFDTGMGRLGFRRNRLSEYVEEITRMKGLRIVGLMSHFSDADMPDIANASEQFGRFRELRDEVMRITGNKPLCHIANSAAVLSMKDSYMDAVRPGIMLYGCSPFRKDHVSGVRDGEIKLRPAMKVKSRILSLRRLPKGCPVSYGGTFITKRESLIAVVPLGYADGYMRSLSNHSDILIGGRRAPVAGRICMDLTVADVTEAGEVKEGDEVVILGKQGREEITAEEIAGNAGTIPYEVLTGLGSRSKRIFLNSRVRNEIQDRKEPGRSVL